MCVDAVVVVADQAFVIVRSSMSRWLSVVRSCVRGETLKGQTLRTPPDGLTDFRTGMVLFNFFFRMYRGHPMSGDELVPYLAKQLIASPLIGASSRYLTYA